MTDQTEGDAPRRGFTGRLKQGANSAWEQTTQTSRSLYEGAAVPVRHLGNQYQNSRAREYVDSLLKQADEGMNTISGRAMYELVRERLELQDRYNDLLATKLQEALDRIEGLEQSIAKREGDGDDNEDR